MPQYPSDIKTEASAPNVDPNVASMLTDGQQTALNASRELSVDRRLDVVSCLLLVLDKRLPQLLVAPRDEDRVEDGLVCAPLLLLTSLDQRGRVSSGCGRVHGLRFVAVSLPRRGTNVNARLAMLNTWEN